MIWNCSTSFGILPFCLIVCVSTILISNNWSVIVENNFYVNCNRTKSIKCKVLRKYVFFFIGSSIGLMQSNIIAKVNWTKVPGRMRMANRQIEKQLDWNKRDGCNHLAAMEWRKERERKSRDQRPSSTHTYMWCVIVVSAEKCCYCRFWLIRAHPV